MRILLSAIHAPVSAARSLYWAMRDAGHEVLSVGPFQNVMDWAGPTPLYCYEWTPDINTHIEVKLPWDPDRIIQTDAIIGRFGDAPNVLYALDNHVGDYNGGDGFDRIYLGHSWGKMSELPNAEWLPAGYDPRYHKWLRHGDRDLSVLFMGTEYPNRLELMGYLWKCGLGVWAPYGVPWPEYNAWYNRAKIALVKSKCGDLAARVFEHMAAGCCVVMDRVKDADKIGLVDGEHYLGYDSAEECAGVIRDALGNCKRREAIAERGHEWVKPHTWDARAGVLCSANRRPKDVL